MPDRRVAGLRVGDVPVAGRDLRQQREHGVAEVAGARDQLPRAAREEPVRLRVVDLAARDGPRDRLEVGRDPSGCRRPSRTVTSTPSLERALVAGDDRGADAAVPLVRRSPRRAGRRSPRALPRSRRARRRRRRSRGRRSSGMPASVVAISCSSSYAGHDDRDASCRRASTRAPVRAAIGSQRSAAKSADDQPDQAGDDHRVARAAGGRLRGHAAVEHAGKLDLLRLGEELPRLEPVLLERSAPLFHRQEQRAEGQALGRGRAVQLGTDLIRLLIDRVELLLVGGDLLPESVDLQLRVAARDGGDLGGDRIRSRACLAVAWALRPSLRRADSARLSERRS